MTPKPPNKPRQKRRTFSLLRTFRFDAGSLVVWALVLTVVLLSAALPYLTPKEFVGSFFMNAAFTVIGSVLIAVILNDLLQAREIERWAGFDLMNLEHTRYDIHVFLFHSLVRTAMDVSISVNDSFNLDWSEFMHIETRTSLASFQRYTTPVTSYLGKRCDEDPSRLGEVILRNPLELEKALDHIEDSVKYIIMSPYAPINCLTTLRELSRCRQILKDTIRNEWTSPIDAERQKQTVAVFLLHTNQAAFDAYEALAREIEKRQLDNFGPL